MKDDKPFKMSKRKGDYITIEDLIKEVGKDATRFIMLNRSSDVELDFDFDAVGDLFSSSNGIAKRLSELVDTYNDDTLSSDGILDARIDTLNDELTDVDVRRSTLLTRLSAREAVMVSKFAAADAIIASLNTTSDFLTQNLVGLNKSDD